MFEILSKIESVISAIKAEIETHMGNIDNAAKTIEQMNTTKFNSHIAVAARNGAVAAYQDIANLLKAHLGGVSGVASDVNTIMSDVSSFAADVAPLASIVSPVAGEIISEVSAATATVHTITGELV